MLRMMDKKEKAAYVDTIPKVAEAPEEVLTGTRWSIKRRPSKTASGSRAAERKWYMGHEFVRIGDHVVKFGRPGIDRTVYYDDEYPDPLSGDEAARKEAWKWYNLRHSRKELPDMSRLDGRYYFDGTYRVRPFCFRSYDGTSYIVWNADHRDEGRYPEPERRYLSDSEIDDLGVIFEQMNLDYEKRLESYWRRYSDKVYSYGYWANR